MPELLYVTALAVYWEGFTVTAGGTARTVMAQFRLPVPFTLTRVDVHFGTGWVRGAAGDTVSLVVRDNTTGQDLKTIDIGDGVTDVSDATPVQLPRDVDLQILLEIVSASATTPPTAPDRGNVVLSLHTGQQ